MTDDHSWTFPSQAFPLLGTANIGFRGLKPRVFSAADLTDLVEFAAVRGVRGAGCINHRVVPVAPCLMQARCLLMATRAAC
jgi:hypothetical protein